jgi:hypothetical protein
LSRSDEAILRQWEGSVVAIAGAGKTAFVVKPRWKIVFISLGF